MIIAAKKNIKFTKKKIKVEIIIIFVIKIRLILVRLNLITLIFKKNKGHYNVII